MRRSLLAPALVVICALLATWPALQGSFVYDDRQYVAENPVVQGQAPIWGSALGDPELALWRPLTVASWRAQWTPGTDAAPFLLGNLVLHALASLLVLLLGRRLGLPPPAALIGAALFAVHPIHAEAVAWVTGRSELLAALLVSAAWCAHLSPHRGRSWAALPLLALACASKENAFVAPALFALGDLALARGALLRGGATLDGGTTNGGSATDAAPSSHGDPADPPRRPGALLRLAALFAVAGAMFLARSAVLPDALPGAGPYHDTPLPGRLGVALAVVGQAVRLLLLPAPLRIHYDRNELLVTQPVLLGCAAALAVAATLLWRRERVVAALLLALPVALGPVLHLVPMGEPFAERFLYLPSAPFCLALGGLAVALARHERRGPGLAVVLVAAALLGGAFASRRAVAVFRDDLTLWAHAAQVRPDLAVVRFNHATFLERAGRYLTEDDDRPGVGDELRASLRLHPDHRYAAYAHQTLGHLALGALGSDLPDAVEASRHYRLALEKLPTLVDARLDLAGIALSRPDVVPALEAQALVASVLAEPALEPARRAAATQLLIELSPSSESGDTVGDEPESAGKSSPAGS